MWRRMAPVLAVVALMAAACGGSDEAGGIATLDQEGENLALDQGGAFPDGLDQATAVTGDGEMDPEEAMLAYTECMREQGIAMADPVMDDEGNLRLSRPERVADGEFNREEMMAAREACAPLFEGVAQQFERPDETEFQDGLLAYAACMRENGYDMPDPDLTSSEPGTGGGQPGGGGRFGISHEDRDDPAFQAANGVCQDLFIGGSGPGGGLGGGDR